MMKCEKRNCNNCEWLDGITCKYLPFDVVPPKIFEELKTEMCENCKDGYCTYNCKEVKKAEKMQLFRIQDAYRRHQGDMVKVFQYIRQYRLAEV